MKAKKTLSEGIFCINVTEEVFNINLLNHMTMVT